MTGHTRKGVSDIIGVLPGGRALFIEVKSAKGKASEHQLAFIKDANDAGALAFVTSDLSDVLLHLSRIDGIDKTTLSNLNARLNNAQ